MVYFGYQSSACEPGGLTGTVLLWLSEARRVTDQPHSALCFFPIFGGPQWVFLSQTAFLGFGPGAYPLAEARLKENAYRFSSSAGMQE